ncbi:30S ribosomal protein S12 [Thelohanellus kitauei]|uniref:Small ribosomal subunit protein uS12m n=1 Tax=Thelohanellus kitauei TaxID=669202 RepID=A0A0C2MSE4_THEKT|nr:30S ribosomal protein S12 [Thelohanellus kitauei]
MIGARPMTTLNQKRRFAKKYSRVMERKYNKNPETVLKGPQRKGVVIKVYAIKPKKPNSGQRKSVLVKLNDGKKVVAYMPGEKARVQENGIVLIRGGRVQDCPGVRYKVIRGKYDIN